MPSGYQQLAQSADEETDVGDESLQGSGRRGRGLRRAHRPGPIDLSKLDNAFKRWTESIAQKVKRKKKVQDHSRKQIMHSVFEPAVVITGPPPTGLVKTLDHNPPMTKEDFDAIAQSVRSAIASGIQPKMITKGSSGSYFARSKLDGRVQTVAVFKPKDEEPYGRLNPKTTKWIHRQFRWIIPFGRACLIPNLSYISEAAASLLDQRLDLNIVPRTQLVSLSSSAFFYDWIDRNQAKKGKPLPDKIGSMQYFLHGFTDASDFLRKHPWPGRAISDTFDDATHRKGSIGKKFMSAIQVICGRTGQEEDMFDDDEIEEQSALFDQDEHDSGRPFYWTKHLQNSFRQELEKLVILDYLMLNTDRGADNYMIKYCEGDHEKALVDIAPTKSNRPEMPLMSELRRTEPPTPHLGMSASNPSLPSVLQSGTETPSSNYTRQPHIHIAAIDNSLSFPHEHPRGWRSYTYGWLYLPVSIIGRPFSEKTRNHFLPLLTSKVWWEETTFELRKLFAVDPDFHPKMFRRQMAVIKGQAWNIVQSLKHSDEGPLELTRRTKQLVWDDEVEAKDLDLEAQDVFNPPLSASPKPSINTMPLPRRTRSQSAGDDGFPPPIRRTSTEAARPVPFAAKFQKIHQSVTGVTVLEHLERLDAVEASLKRLGNADGSVIEEEEEDEIDVGESSQTKPISIPQNEVPLLPTGATPRSQLTPPGSPLLSTVHEDAALEDSVTEEDLAVMSKSLSHVDRPPMGHGRWPTIDGRQEGGSQTLEWMHNTELPSEASSRTVIVERMETINAKPLLSCW